jgi:CBS-domain-containing membrane protein
VITYDELALAFQARHIAVPMEIAVSVRAEDAATEAAGRLSAHHFDQAPVLQDGVPIGFVLTRRLNEVEGAATIADVMAPIRPGNVVSADAPVGELLDWIIEPGLLFVLDGRRIAGFVTVSDFNKQAARAYFYLLMTSLETGLADLVRARFGAHQEHAFELLSEEARATVENRFEAARADNTEADVVAYLDFSHLLRVIGRDEQLRRGLAVASRNAWDQSVGRLPDLRNLVMHPVRDLVTSKVGLIELQEVQRLAHSLLQDVTRALDARTFGPYAAQAEA